jgi:hypothetical protein
MYLLSTILNVPPPPLDLLFSHKEGIPVEDVTVKIAAEAAESVEVQAGTEAKK